MKSNLVNDWHPETRTLLDLLLKAGFAITGGSNGEESFAFGSFPTVDRFLDELLACDEATLFVRSPDHPEKSLGISLVMGNSPGELVSDYSYTLRTAASLDAVTSRASSLWFGKRQPTKPATRKP